MIGIMIFFIILIIAALLYYLLRDRQSVLIPLMFMLLVVLMGAVFDVPDYGPYERFFYFSQYIDFENFDEEMAQYYYVSNDQGYMMLNRICFNLGMDYPEFRFLTTAISVMIISFVIFKMTHNIFLVLFLYLLYPFMMDVCQVRNFMGEVILLLTLYLCSRNIKKSKIIFLGLMILASMLQKTFIVYAFFVLLWYIRGVEKLRWIYRLLLIVGVLMPFYEGIIIGKYDDMIQIMQATSDQYNATTRGYLTGETRLGYLVAYFKFIPMFIVIKYIRNKYNESGIKKQFINLVYLLHEYMFVIMPVIGITATAWRYPRNLLLPLYICCAIYLERKTNNRFLFFIAVTSMAISIAAIESGGDFSVLWRILSNNYLWG